MLGSDRACLIYQLVNVHFVLLNLLLLIPVVDASLSKLSCLLVSVVERVDEPLEVYLAFRVLFRIFLIAQLVVERWSCHRTPIQCW